MTRLIQYLTGSLMKTSGQWEVAVENKNETETTERIRLLIEAAKRRVGYCHTATLIIILPPIGRVGLITSFLNVTKVSRSEKGSKLGGRQGFKLLESKQM